MARNTVGFSELTRHIREDLEKYQNLKLRVRTGDEFFDGLFYGTLATLVNRVDPTGYCQTSYGEEGGIQRYPYTHYPRDTAEAARLLAHCGRPDLALRIISFTLNNCPEKQRYIPHVYRPDGSIQANTVQVDTPGHVALAMRDVLSLLPESREKIRPLYQKLVRLMQTVFEDHWHADWQLLDAGNYNEQGFGGSSNPICDFFSNAAFSAGLRALSTVAREMGDEAAAARMQEQYRQITAGIEKSLYDSKLGRYYLMRDAKDGSPCTTLNWSSLHPQRWYPGHNRVWNPIIDALRETEINWAGHNVITGSVSKADIKGKVFGHLLGVLAQTGRFAMLDDHLGFIRDTVQRPRNVYPEVWNYQRTPPEFEFSIWFEKEYGQVWPAYKDEPDGDYTIDSGNCEQVSVFMTHFLVDLLGIGYDSAEGTFRLWPKLPFSFKNVQVEQASVRWPDGTLGQVGYQQERTDSGLKLKVSGLARPTPIRLAIPASARQQTVTLNGHVVSAERTKTGYESDWLDLDVPAGESQVVAVMYN